MDELILGPDEAHLEVASLARITQGLDLHFVAKFVDNLSLERVEEAVVTSSAALKASITGK